jgi:hypothetical protein
MNLENEKEGDGRAAAVFVEDRGEQTAFAKGYRRASLQSFPATRKGKSRAQKNRGISSDRECTDLLRVRFLAFRENISFPKKSPVSLFEFLAL